MHLGGLPYGVCVFGLPDCRLSSIPISDAIGNTFTSQIIKDSIHLNMILDSSSLKILLDLHNIQRRQPSVSKPYNRWAGYFVFHQHFDRHYLQRQGQHFIGIEAQGSNDNSDEHISYVDVHQH